MKIYDLHTLSPLASRQDAIYEKGRLFSDPCVAVLGSFDGVHIGHQKLLCTAVKEAKKRGLLCVVWTFPVPPRNELSHKEPVPLLTSEEEKCRLLAQYELDYAIFEDFSSVRALSPESFVHQILIEQLHAVCVVCGFNFRFGAFGAGDAELLSDLLKKEGQQAITVPPVFCGGKIVSSTAIRLMIEDGALEDAAVLLGRPFSICFPVVSGKQLGRTIGIPTINQNFPDGHIIPKRGIYACTCEVHTPASKNEDIFLGVANVGMRPTVSQGTHINCETHIIHYNGWLYGKMIRVSFYHRLRDEKKFADLETLQAAIRADINHTMTYFSKK